ncbi:MAG TPA: PQQ-binding-like beta-propeller repeat protein [Gaiellaceae bacterium]
MRVAVSLLAASVAVLGGSGSKAATGYDWTRFGWDAVRTSAPTFPTGITAANVGSLKRQQVRLDGTVDSSPIYLHDVKVNGNVHDVFFITTSYGKTEAIDAASGKLLWRFTPSDYSSYAGGAQITNTTPVADPSRQWIYAAAPNGRIYKLAVANGRAAWGVSITKLPSREKMAAPLNFANGHVIAATGGYIGDAPPYQGHVAIISPGGRLLHVWNSLCSNRTGLIEPSSCSASDSAMFGRAGVVVVPGSGQLLTATGNAPWDGRTNWGDAVIRLNPDATAMLGNYTPVNTEELNTTDTDLGSTSPFVLSANYIGQSGKDGKIRVLSVNRMRGTQPHKGGELQVVSTPSGSGLFTAPAIWHRSNVTYVFVADNGTTEAWRFRNGRLSSAWRAGTGGSSPVVAGGLLWVFNPAGGLNVYQPTTGKLITTLATGAGHWNSPIIVDGRVALPEGNSNGHAQSDILDIWRLP